MSLNDTNTPAANHHSRLDEQTFLFNNKLSASETLTRAQSLSVQAVGLSHLLSVCDDDEGGFIAGHESTIMSMSALHDLLVQLDSVLDSANLIKAASGCKQVPTQ